MSNKLKTYFTSLKVFLEKPLSFFICSPLVIAIFGLLSFRFKPTDPDFWWHLKVGADILHKGIQFKDIYSFSLPAYEWIDHEWLLNVLMYGIFSLTQNFLLLSFIFAVLTFLAFYSIILNSLKEPKSSQAQITLWTLCFAALIVPLTCLGVRAITVSILGVSFLWQFLQNKNWLENKKVLWILPLAFCFWANLHGSVLIGLALLALDLLCSFKKNKLLVFLLCAGATLINAYGVQIYFEAFRVFLDGYSHKFIEEWRQPNFIEYKFWAFWLYLTTFVFISIFNYKRLSGKKLQLFAAAVFALLALRSIRHIPLFVIISLPLMTDYLEASLKNFQINFPSKLLLPITIFLWIFCFCTSVTFAVEQFKHNLQANSFERVYYKGYPSAALRFMQQNKLQGNIFAEYGWGGFISWFTPQNKIFIDGRMPSWNGAKLLQDYSKLIKADPKILNKYPVDYVLLKNQSEFADWPLVFQEGEVYLFRNPKHTCHLNT